MAQAHTSPSSPQLKPPVTSVGPLGWMRRNLFNGWLNSLLTVLVLYLLWLSIPPLLKWALWDSLWFSGPEACRQSGGACWSVITQNLRFIIFGFYPFDQHWRPLVAMGLLLALVLASQRQQLWGRRLGLAWLLGLVVMGILMKGGIFGLPPVDSSEWSGLPLTLLLSVLGLLAAYPLGVVLALGRRSQMPLVRTLCVLYIELIRGVPLVSLLFMASVMFPLFLPEGVTVDKILRALAAIILFTAAYLAEVVRGGLAAIALGQHEAAQSLGLNYFQTMRLVVLPQALKIVIPPTVSVLISAFKDTSLVVIIALFDVLNTSKSVLSNPDWMGFSTEVYIFLAALYFLGCFSLSSFSRKLERQLSQGET